MSFFYTYYGDYMKIEDKINNVFVEGNTSIFISGNEGLLKYQNNAEGKMKRICIIYTGGTIGMEKGEKAKDGAAFFAVRTGAKVIPVGISAVSPCFNVIGSSKTA